MCDGSSKPVTVTSPKHHEFLVDRLWSFIQDQYGTDFDLRLGEQSIRAHQLIVDVFLSPEGIRRQESSCRRRETPSKQRMSDDQSCLNALLEFMYNGAVTIPEKQLCKLHKIAKQMNFKMLSDAVESTMIINAASSLGIRVRPRQSPVRVCQQAERRCRKGTPVKLIASRDDDNNPENDGGICTESSSPTPSVDLVNKRLVDRSTRATNAATASNTLSKAQSRMAESQRRISKRRPQDVVEIDVEPEDVDEDDDDDSVDARNSKSPKRNYRTADVSNLTRLERYNLWLERNPLLHCDHCSYKSRSKKNLEVHAAKHATGIPALKCETCAKQFFSEESLRMHEMTHIRDAAVAVGAAGPNRCPYCEFETPKQWKYIYHLKSVHEVNAKGEPAPKRNHCDVCNESFVTLSVLKVHRRIKHTKDRPFKCHMCPYAASRKGDLGIHMKVSHLKLRPAMCELCGFRAISVSSLERHRRTHTGEKPYQCHQCGMSYSDTTSFKRHVQRHNNPAFSEKPFICHVCGHSFSEHRNLVVHMRKSHNCTTTASSSSHQEEMTGDDDQGGSFDTDHPLMSAEFMLPDGYMDMRVHYEHGHNSGFEPDETLQESDDLV